MGAPGGPAPAVPSQSRGRQNLYTEVTYMGLLTGDTDPETR
jgi:hypothetical protein